MWLLTLHRCSVTWVLISIYPTTLEIHPYISELTNHCKSTKLDRWWNAAPVPGDTFRFVLDSELSENTIENF